MNGIRKAALQEEFIKVYLSEKNRGMLIREALSECSYRMI